MVEFSSSQRRTLPERVITWGAGFVLTGRVFHGLRRRDLRKVGPRTALTSVASFALFCMLVYWLAFVAPTDIAAIFLGVPVGLTAMVSTTVVVQWVGTKWLEANQYLRTAYSVTIHRYLLNGLRNRLPS